MYQKYSEYSVIRTTFFVAVFLAGNMLLRVPAAQAQANVQGTWQTLPTTMPINPVHTALLSNGKILVVSGSGSYSAQTLFYAGVFDPLPIRLQLSPSPGTCSATA